jgi:hypothetical protein
MESFAETERCFERYREKFDFAGARELGGIDQGWAVDRALSRYSVSATVATSARFVFGTRTAVCRVQRTVIHDWLRFGTTTLVPALGI